MKRKTEKDIVREHKGIVIFFSVIVLIGIIVPFLTLIPKPEYQYEEKSIHVDRVEYDVRWISTASSGYYTRLITSDGEQYIINNQDGAYETAFTDADLTIRYHESTFLFWKENDVDTVTWSGGTFDTHREVSDGHWYVAVIAGAVIVMIGAGGLLIVYFDVKRNRRMQKARDQRIIKKYGEKAKVK